MSVNTFKCKNTSTVPISYGKPEKIKTKYHVSCENSENTESDLLFQTPILELKTSFDESCDPGTDVEFVVDPASGFVEFFDRMKAQHIDHASVHSSSWFPGKNVSDEILPDLWKDTIATNAKTGDLRFRAKLSDDEEEPVMFFDNSGNHMSPTEFSAGNKVCLLMRFNGLIFGKASFCESYTVLQIMKVSSKKAKKLKEFSFSEHEDPME